jgi:hypothetical protein
MPAKQPGLEGVEANGAAPRGARALVQHDHPGQTLAVTVRDEHLEARVGLVAPGEVADRAEGGHSGAAEVMEGAGIRSVLVPECTAVAGVAGWVPCRPGPPVGRVHDVAVVHPPRAHRRAVRGRRPAVIDWIGRGQRRRGGENQRRRDCKQRRKHEADRLAGGAGGIAGPPGYGVIATIRSIGSRARSASAGSTFTTGFRSRSASRSFGSVIIFMYLQTAARFAGMKLLPGFSTESG